MKDIKEYLRRNLVQASSVGAAANIRNSLARVKSWRNPPKWLVTSLEGALEGADKLPKELAKWRNLMR